MDRLLSVSDPSSFVSAETGSVVEPVQSWPAPASSSGYRLRITKISVAQV